LYNACKGANWQSESLFLKFIGFCHFKHSKASQLFKVKALLACLPVCGQQSVLPCCHAVVQFLFSAPPHLEGTLPPKDKKKPPNVPSRETSISEEEEEEEEKL
jgi:hypothetical protein